MTTQVRRWWRACGTIDGAGGQGRAHSRLAIALLLLAGPVARAQMPVLPVLQNGFVAPGTAAAVNLGSSSGASAYAAALSWAPTGGRFQLALGGGVFGARSGQNWPGYGGRVAVPVRQFANGSIGVAAFAGIGGGRHDSSSVVRVPVGVSAGWRRDLGPTRGISVYATPFFAWTRSSVGGRAAARRNALRGSLGADLALARAFGVTVGYEFGRHTSDSVAAEGGSFGAGLSYVFR